MNEASFEAKVDGEPLSLSAKEFKLLLVFAKNPERVYSREMLLSLVWDNAYVDERTVDVHMLRLRNNCRAPERKISFRPSGVWDTGHIFRSKVSYIEIIIQGDS